ncbi:MAG: alpha-hydroxy-acid oxidizing protein, partial [Actinomycetota bacterium]
MTTRRIPRWGDFSHLVGFTSGSSLDHCASIADVRRLARRRVPRAVFDYTDGAAGDELSLRRARAAFARVEF